MKLNKVFILSALFILASSSCMNNIGLQEPILQLTKIESFILDGNRAEWHEKQKIQLFCNQSGKTPDQADLSASFQFGHTGSELAFYFQIEDDLNYIDTLYPWNGDAVEIFLAPFKGSEEITQVYICLKYDENGEPFIKINDSKKTVSKGLEISVKGSKIGTIHELEVLIGLEEFKTDWSVDSLFAIQVYIDDSDKKNDKEKNRLTWFNSNYSSETSLSYFPATLSQGREFFPESTSRIEITDNENIVLRTFGFEEGDLLKVYKASGGEVKKLLEKIVSDYEIDHYDLSKHELDFERDSLFVYNNEVCISFHDLILSPREYQKIEQPRFYNEIRIFKARDKFSFPEPNSCLFIGSSSIRMWKTLEEDFPELNIIRRGFGGSNTVDALNYMEDIVFPYMASQVVYYEGDNDIPAGIPVDSILNNIKTFVDRIKEINPDTEIFLISPKPAIVRMRHWEKYLDLNKSLKDYASKNDKIEFVDVASEMFLSNGNLNDSLFIEDNLHMNVEGYKIWTKVLRELMGLK